MTQPTVSKHWWETSARLSHNWSHVTHTARQHSYLGERQLRETFDGKHHHCYHTTEVMSHTQRDNIATSESGSWQRRLTGNINTVITQLKSCHTQRQHSYLGEWQLTEMFDGKHQHLYHTTEVMSHTQRQHSYLGEWQLTEMFDGKHQHRYHTTEVMSHTERQHSYLGEWQLTEMFDGKHQHCYHTTEVMSHTQRQHSYLGERQLTEMFDGKHQHCYHTTEVMSHTERQHSYLGEWQLTETFDGKHQHRYHTTEVMFQVVALIHFTRLSTTTFNK